MREAMLTSLAGLLGVLVGAWLGPLFTSRTVQRADARLAARLARVGLRDWMKAIEISRDATTRLRDQPDFDIALAIELGALRQSLDLRWWEDNKTALLRRAHAEDEYELVMAAKVCTYILWRLNYLGDAGWDAHSRRTKAAIASSQRLKAAREDAAADALPSHEARDDAHDEGWAAAQQQMANLSRDADELNENLEELKVLVAGFDHKIAMAREIWSELIGISDQLDRALEACRTIERQSGSEPAPGR